MAAPPPVVGSFPQHFRRRTGSIAWPKRPNDASSHKFFGSSRKKQTLGWGAEPTRFGSPQHTRAER